MLAPCDSKIGPLKDAVEEPPERAPEGELTPPPAMVRVSPLMVTPFTRRVAPSATVVADALPVAPRPKAFVISSVPASMVVAPVKVFAPERICVLGPSLMRVPSSLITPAKLALSDP